MSKDIGKFSTIAGKVRIDPFLRFTMNPYQSHRAHCQVGWGHAKQNERLDDFIDLQRL